MILGSKGIYMKGTEKLELQLSTQCSRKNFNLMVFLFKIAKSKVKHLLQINMFSET